MIDLRFAPRLVVLLTTLTLVACSSGAEAPKAIDPAEVAYLKENDKAMAAMMTHMAVKPTGDVDKDFALMMIPHHQGAIAMAEAQLKYGKNEELKQLSRNIIANQAEEIALMRRVIGDTPAVSAGTTTGHDHAK